MAINKVTDFPIERLKFRRLIAAAAKGEITMRELEKQSVLERSVLDSMVNKCKREIQWRKISEQRNAIKKRRC